MTDTQLPTVSNIRGIENLDSYTILAGKQIACKEADALRPRTSSATSKQTDSRRSGTDGLSAKRSGCSLLALGRQIFQSVPEYRGEKALAEECRVGRFVHRICQPA